MTSIEDYLDTLSDKVTRNVEVVTPESLQLTHLLHISPDTGIKKFIPQIGFRQAKSEDRTVPRVCVGQDLLGCVHAHAMVYNLFMNNASDGSKQHDKYKGGFVIYAIPFEYALRPNKRLVFDAEETGECWLVSYDNEHTQYVPEVAGKFFVRFIQFVGSSSEFPTEEPTLYAEITSQEGIWFSKEDLKLQQGYWKLESAYEKESGHLHWIVKEISKSDYLKAKNESAALLSYNQPAPSYLLW